MSLPAYAYLSILDWPENLAEAERAGLIERAVGVGAYEAGLIARRGTPMVAARIGSKRARGAMDALYRAGVTAIAPTQSEMDARSGFVSARALQLGNGGGSLLVTPWEGEPFGFSLDELFLMIRATLRTRETREQSRRRSSGGLMPAMALGGSVGLAAAVVASDQGATGEGRRSVRVQMTEMLDLHLRDGRRVRVNAGRFVFSPKLRGYTQRENTDRLAVALAERAPGALLDTNFQHFKCPGTILKSYLSGGAGRVQRRTQAPEFDFYSVWAMLMYRRLVAG